MFKICIIHAHWYNRGDEAALRATVDFILSARDDVEIYLVLMADDEYTEMGERIHQIKPRIGFMTRYSRIEFLMRCISRGKIGIDKGTAEFIKLLSRCDYVLHAPGGPSIGDIYMERERRYLYRLFLAKKLKIPYAFFAPSMGPFTMKKNSWLRRAVLEGAQFICVREPQSAAYLSEYKINKKVYVTMDAAFQYQRDDKTYLQIYENEIELKNFMDRHEKVIGMTITDLVWHPVHGKNRELKDCIDRAFSDFIDYFHINHIGVLFIPQLFGKQNDYDYMNKFMKNNCYIIPNDKLHDCYYQQYIIKKLYMLVGMRYHSNIFSAKQGVPFISISYEQKMSGFMESAGLAKYCIPLEKLSFENLLQHYELVENTYDWYKRQLEMKSEEWIDKSRETSHILFKTIDNIINKSK